MASFELAEEKEVLQDLLRQTDNFLDYPVWRVREFLKDVEDLIADNNLIKRLDGNCGDSDSPFFVAAADTGDDGEDYEWYLLDWLLACDTSSPKLTAEEKEEIAEIGGDIKTARLTILVIRYGTPCHSVCHHCPRPVACHGEAMHTIRVT